MSATLASPLNTGSTVPALTPVTVPCKTPTCAWATAAPSNSAMTTEDFFSFLMSALRNRVARRLAGNDALYWRRREFSYPSQYRVDPTRQSPTHPGARAAHWCARHSCSFDELPQALIELSRVIPETGMPGIGHHLRARSGDAVHLLINDSQTDSRVGAAVRDQHGLAELRQQIVIVE